MVGMSAKDLGENPKLRGHGMSTAQTEARTLVELIAGPMRLGENTKAALTRVARATGFGDRRIRAIWNSEARLIRAEEMDRLRQVALDARTREEASRAYQAHLARLAACSAALRIHDQIGDRDAAPQLGRLAGGDDRAMDQGGPR